MINKRTTPTMYMFLDGFVSSPDGGEPEGESPGVSLDSVLQDTFTVELQFG